MGKGRRAAVEIIDPRTEEPLLYCQRCAERTALGYLLKRQTPPVRRVHADDAAAGKMPHQRICVSINYSNQLS